MFRRVHIEYFRCFKRLNLDEIKNFNLIIGKNNTGKSALLEALFVLCGSHNPGVPGILDTLRGVVKHQANVKSLWSNLFFNLDTTRPIRMQATDYLMRPLSTDISLESILSYKTNIQRKTKSKDGKMDEADSSQRLKFVFNNVNSKRYVSYSSIKEGKIEYVRNDVKDFMPGMFISTRTSLDFREEAIRFGNLLIKNKDKQIVESLKIIEPRIKRIFTVPLDNTTMIFADIGLPEAIEINYLGEGVLRLFQILLAMAEVERGIILIDEIERGFHYSFYETTLQVIYDFAKQIKSQVFATTHSKEYITATFNYFNKTNDNDLSVFRLDKKEEDIRVTNYNASELREVIEQNWEIR